MSLKPYVYCLVFVLFPLNLSGQQPYLKTAYDSIIQLDIPQYEKDDLLAYFFKKNENINDQQELALCYHEYAIKIYKTNLKKAIEYETKAITIREQYQNDHESLKKSLYSMGFFYEMAGDYFKAVATYQKLAEMKVKDNLTSKAYTRLGLAYSDMGDFQKALSNYNKAETYLEEKKDTINLFKNHINHFYLYNFMGILEFQHEVRYHIKKADSLKNLLINAGIPVNDQDNLVLSQAKGNLFDDLENYHEALKHHKNSLEISLKMEDFYEISRSYNNLGMTASSLNNNKEARIYYNNALAYAEDDPITQAIVFDNLGDYHLDKKEFVKALQFYQKAINYVSGQEGISYFEGSSSIENLALSPYKLDLLTYLTDKADAWIDYYEDKKNKEHLNNALHTLQLADSLVDIIRFESTEFQSKLFWRQKGADIYMNAVNVCYQLSLPQKAFYFMEKNKALLLLEDLTHENAKKNARLPDVLAAREFMLKQKIYMEEQELIDAVAAPKAAKDSLRDLIFNDKRSYEKFIDSLETQYPDYYNYKRKSAVIKYDDVLAAQQENDAMLHYILNEEEGYGLLVSRDNPRFFKIDTVDALHKNIELLRKKLTHPLNTKEALKNYQNLAFQLYKTLFPGIGKDFLTDKKICVIPDHDLQQLPFDVLMTSPDDKNTYLLNQCQISYAYSASFLKLNQAVQRDPPNYFIGFAPVYFNLDEGTLNTLNESSEEISQISGMFPGDLFLQQSASKQNFIDNASDYKVIHLATHADVGKNTRPWIAFSDDKLSLEELYATKNQAYLVVLSACNTSQGELRTGEGLMSLARGFFSSGTQSVVATLWNVNDQSTKKIMVEFYRQLKKGRTRGEALQYAKQQYLKNHSGSSASPYYWSSLILIGDAGQLSLPPARNTNYILAVGTGIVILLMGLWARWYFRKQDTA